jgi:hypothetical protein
MRDNFILATDRLAKDHYLKPASEAIERITKVYEKYPVAKQPGPGEMPLEDQLIGHLIELLRAKFLELDRVAVSNEKLTEPSIPGRR